MTSHKKKNLYLIGAGDFGREMESWLELIPNFYNEWDVKGFLDDNLEALKGFPSDYSIVGKPLEYHFKADDYVLICITNSKVKKLITKELSGRVNFYTYIAPNTIIGKFTKIMEGSVIAPNSIVSTNVVIEQFVTINCGSQIGHDCTIGAYSSLMSNVDLGGDVRLAQCVFMGTNSTIIPRKKINEYITVGAGSIVVNHLKKVGTYFGNPATLITF